MKIHNITQNTLIAAEGEVADTMVSRLVGLLGRPFLPASYALIITQTRSIHMFFMKFPIDVIFADKNDAVIGIVENIQPFGMSPYFWRASYCIELPTGTIAQTRTRKGDQLRIEK